MQSVEAKSLVAPLMLYLPDYKIFNCVLTIAFAATQAFA